MDSNKVRQVFVFGTDSYFTDLLRKVDLINPTSKSRGEIEQLYAAMRAAAEESTPNELKRDVVEPANGLLTPGTSFYFRRCPLVPQGPKELIAMLTIDVSRLPQSCLKSIDFSLSQAPELLTPVRLVTFVLTKGIGVGFQRVMLVATKNSTGSLVLVPHSFHWSVSGKVLGGEDLTHKAEQEADRLTYLLHLVMNEDATTLHSSPSGQRH
jgi:hypothetical protein